MAFDDRARQRPAFLPQGARIAVIGSGITGLGAAWHLSRTHEVTVFEADDRFGGHSNTVVAELSGQSVPVDTGFIVYNERNYPNLVALFDALGVKTAASDMSFAVSMRDGALEYSGQSLRSVFARPGAALSPRYLRMLADVPRFHHHARQALKQALPADDMTLAQFIGQRGFSPQFVTDFLQPIAGAIWSSPDMAVLDYPAVSFLRFFANHGLLQVLNMPLWRTVEGGSHHYVDALIAATEADFRRNSAVHAVTRHAEGKVTVTAQGAAAQDFDAVVFANHGDQARHLLADKSAEEDRILGGFSYQKNRAVLHTDPAAMPKRRVTWSAWNVVEQAGRMTVTYWMNRLQPLGIDTDIFVTLNPAADLRGELAAFDYDHPQYSLETLKSQRAIWAIQGQGGVYFAGAHLGAGFHEDGLQAGLAVAEMISGEKRPWTVPGESARLYLPSGLVVA